MLARVVQVVSLMVAFFFFKCYSYPVEVCSADEFEQLNWCNQAHGSSRADDLCRRINASYKGSCKLRLVALTDVNDVTAYIWKNIGVCKHRHRTVSCISTNPDPQNRTALLVWTYNSSAKTCSPKETIDNFFGGGYSKEGEGSSSKDDSSGAGGGSSGGDRGASSSGGDKSKTGKKGGSVGNFFKRVLRI